MRAPCLQIAVLGWLAVFTSGCGGDSFVHTAPGCTPLSPPTAAYVVNNSLNTISMYTVNSCTGALTATNPPTVTSGTAGGAPHTVVVAPSGKFAHVSNQVDGTVSMYSVNSSTGVLTPTTPPTIATGTFPLGLTVDPSGKFVYVANDTASEVSMYTINSSTGNLTPTTSPTVATGAGPQGIAVDPSGEFVYVPQELPMSALTA